MNETEELLADFTTAFAHSLSEAVRAISKRSSQNFSPRAIAGDIRLLANSLPDDRPRVKSIMIQIATEMELQKSSGRI